jgi:predicted amidohydrolase YtcJ
MVEFAADQIFLADNVLTMGHESISGPAAVVVTRGRIDAVVPRRSASRFAGEQTQIRDAGPRTLAPGFVDPHAHFEVAARTRFLTVDCRAPRCGSVPDVLDALRDGLSDARDGWLVGQGNLFFDLKLAERRFPSREELDSVSRDVAIAVRAGGHVSVLNSKALELAGIGEDFQSVSYSVTGKPSVERDSSGAPTGVVKEMDNLLPFPRIGDDELRVAITDGMRDLYTQHGVTTLGEISESREGLAVMDQAHVAGSLATRLLVYLWAPGTGTIDEVCDPSWLSLAAAPDLMRVRGVKVFADGGYSAARAAMKRPYALDGHSHGELAMTRAELEDVRARTAAAALQLAIHANGDRAQAEVCAALEARAEEYADAPAVRMEHAGNFIPDYESTTDAYRRAGVIPVSQPVFLHSFAEFLPDYVGEYARKNQFPYRRMLDDGWSLSGSSDVWVGSEIGQTNPFLGISCSVNRTTLSGQLICPEERIGVEEAIAMYTIGAARAMEVEPTRGSLEAGKLADILVLDRDPRFIDPRLVGDTAVDHVYVNGDLVHSREYAEQVREISREELLGC